MDNTRNSIYIDICEAGYTSGEPVIKNIKFSVKRGESILITGPSGSGKTTLILALIGVLNNLLEGYVDGNVSIFGINPLDPQEFTSIPETIGVVLQDPEKQLSMSTPYDEVAFTLENLGYSSNDIDRLTREILNWMGLGNKMFIDSLYLSGGEKKRLCIASSIVHKPRLLILDEPTANLDPWGVKELLEYIELLKSKGYTLIIVEHKAKYFLNLSDRILLIKDGELKKIYQVKNVKPHDLENDLANEGVDASCKIQSKGVVKSGGEVLYTVDGVSFRYSDKDEEVISNVTLEIYKGDVVLFMGPNGSGKTTLLKLLAGFYKPTRGKITLHLDGRSISLTRPTREVFYISQEPDYMFIYGSVKDELWKSGAEQDVIRLLEEVPWLRNLMDESPYNLSHGQRRWLAYYIARLYNPDIYLFDEPSAGLDLNLLRRFLTWIMSIREKGKTIIIATHDPRLLQLDINSIFLVKDGRVEKKDVKDVIGMMNQLFRGG